MSNYLATVTFENGECLIGIYNNTSDNLLARSLLPDSPEARHFIGAGDRDEWERFEALHVKHYGVSVAHREQEVCATAQAPTGELVRVYVPGYDASFRSAADRANRFVVGTVCLPDFIE